MITAIAVPVLPKDQSVDHFCCCRTFCRAIGDHVVGINRAAQRPAHFVLPVAPDILIRSGVRNDPPTSCESSHSTTQYERDPVR
jgi:hypothetical protein